MNRDNLDVGVLFRILRQRKWPVAGVFLGSAVVIFLLLLLFKNEYRTDVGFIIQKSGEPTTLQSYLNKVPGFGGGRLFSGSGIEEGEAIGFILSDEHLSSIVDRYGLRGELDDDWDKPDSLITAAYYAELLRDRIELTYDEVQGIHRLYVKWPDPHLAANLANSMIASADSMLRIRERERLVSVEKALLDKVDNTSEIEIQKGLQSARLENLMSQAMLMDRDYLIRSVDKAYPPAEHHSPKRLRISLVAAILISLALVLAFYYQSGSRTD